MRADMVHHTSAVARRLIQRGLPLIFFGISWINVYFTILNTDVSFTK